MKLRLIVLLLALSFGLSVPGCIIRTSPDHHSEVRHKSAKGKKHKRYKKGKKYKKHKKHKKSKRRARKKKKRKTCPSGYFLDDGKCRHKSELY